MSDTYTPRTGTLAARLIAHLTEAGVSTMSSAEIGQQFDVASGVSTMLSKAVDAGLLIAEKGAGGRMEYSLPEPPPEPGGELQIALYHDGDVGVKGGVEGEDGSVLYTKAQIEQLLRRVTAPHIVLAAPAVAS
jgi:hypothetical protein